MYETLATKRPYRATHRKNYGTLEEDEQRKSVGVSARQIILQLPVYDTAYLEAATGRASSSRPEVDGRRVQHIPSRSRSRYRHYLST